MVVNVKLLADTNHGKEGQWVAMQSETAEFLVDVGLASMSDEEIIDFNELDEDDSGDEPGQADDAE